MSEFIERDGFVPVTGGRVWFHEVRSNEATPVLLLHGGPGVASDYFEPLEALAHEWPVIRYDQLGGGRSDHPDDVSLWTIDRFVEELGQVREELNLTQVHLYGHSWGSALAVAYMATRPSGVVSLSLAGPWLNASRYVTDVEKLRSQLPEEIQAALGFHEDAGTTESDEYRAASMEFMRRNFCRVEEVLEAIAGEDMPPVYQYMWGPSELLPGTGPLKNFDVTYKVHEITVPTLLTCGRHDEITPETTAWYQRMIPGSEMVVSEESAHFGHIRETDRYLRVMRDFIRRAESVSCAK